MDIEKIQILSNIFLAQGFSWKVLVLEDETSQRWIAMTGINTAISYIPPTIELPPEIAVLQEIIQIFDQFSRKSGASLLDSERISVENLWLFSRVLSNNLSVITYEYTKDNSEVELVARAKLNGIDMPDLVEYPQESITAAVCETMVSDIERFEQFVSTVIATNSTVRIIWRVFQPGEVEEFTNFYMREF